MPSRKFSTVLCQHACTWRRQNRKGRYQETTKAASQHCYPDSCHLAHRSAVHRKSEYLSVPSSEVGCFGWDGLPNSRLMRKLAVLQLSAGKAFLREILIPTLRKSVWLCYEQGRKPWERIAFPVHSDAGVRTCWQCPMAVNGKRCSLMLKIPKGLAGGSIIRKENSTELACNYTKVIDRPQQGGMGVTEILEYLIKSPPTYCVHHSHLEILRCCRYDHIPN